MKLGIDLSMAEQLEESHPIYRYKEKEIDPFEFFGKEAKVSLMRLRLWNDPYDNEGNPYGGGTNDLPRFIRLAKRAIKAGMKILLDFHYSDFWVDPGKQRLPKTWVGLSMDEILGKVYEFTKETLVAIKQEGIDLYAIQIGNEITHGMVWPYGEVTKEYQEGKGGGFKGFAMLFKAGHKACKEIYPEALTMFHITHPGDYKVQDWCIGSMMEEGIEFDVLGESYYPYWHGTLPVFEESLSKIMTKYKKPVWIIEMGYEWRPSTVPGHQGELNDGGEEFRPGNINGRVPFPLTKEGQADYLKYFLKTCKKLGVELICYWEPTWIQLPHSEWADDAGQIYCGLTPTKAYNDWANETLFDDDGNANPGVDIFTQDYVDSL